MVLRCLQEYYQQLDKGFHLLYASVLETAQAEGLHDFRVNLKKLVAFINMVPYFSQTFHTELAQAPFATLLKKTGPLRDLHVGLEVLKSLKEDVKPDQHFLQRLEEKHQKKRKTYRVFTDDSLLSAVREAAATVESHLQHCENRADVWARLFSYYHEKLDEVRRLAECLTFKHNTKALHQWRAQLKEFYLNLLILKKIVPRRRTLGTPIQQLDSLQELLGDWHDQVIVLQLVKKDRKHAPKELKEHFTRAEEEYRRSLYHQLENFPQTYGEILDVLHSVFSHPPLERRVDSATSSRQKVKKIKTSVAQINLAEGMK